MTTAAAVRLMVGDSDMFGSAVSGRSASSPDIAPCAMREPTLKVIRLAVRRHGRPGLIRVFPPRLPLSPAIATTRPREPNAKILRWGWRPEMSHEA